MSFTYIPHFLGLVRFTLNKNYENSFYLKKFQKFNFNQTESQKQNKNVISYTYCYWEIAGSNECITFIIYRNEN